VVNDRHLIQGGQPPEVFEQALRQIAATPGETNPGRTATRKRICRVCVTRVEATIHASSQERPVGKSAPV
jgi:hypothetical protein